MKAMNRAAAAMYALNAVCLVWDPIVHFAYEVRGYQAFGGEYFLIADVFVVVYAAMVFILDRLEWEDVNQESGC